MKRKTQIPYTFRAILSMAVSLLLTAPVGAQQQDLVLGSYSNQTEIRATRSITLTSGFYIPSGKTVRLFIEQDASLIAMPGLPTAVQNYILKTSYLAPVTTAAAATQASQKMQDVAYYDGLGRPVQTVAVKASPSFGDIVQQQAYDSYGRPEKSYLPYAGGNDGSFKGNAVAAQAAFYNSPPPGVVQIGAVGGVTPSFGRTVYEASPLDRVLEQGFPGQAWQPAATRSTATGRTVATVYTTNNATAITDLTNTRQVRLYTVSYLNGWPKLSLDGTYAANQLHVRVTRDENWESSATGFAARLGTTEEYTDKQGRVVLKRSFNSKDGTAEMLSTYYVYDDLGRLCYVLPPGANADAGLPGAVVQKALCYLYQYDGRNRVKRRHLPGKARWEEFNYNMMDQLIIHQTARDSLDTYAAFPTTAGKRYHHFYKYDGQGRMIMAGVEKDREASQETIEGYISEPGRAGTQWEERSSAAGNLHGYTNVSIPNAAGTLDVTEVNYYDRYDGIGLPANLDKAAAYSAMTQGLLVARKAKVLGTTDTYLWTVYYYDARGRNVRTLSQHYKGATVSANNYDDVTNTYSFSGRLTKSVRVHYAGSTTATVTVTTEYTYDHRDRLLDTWKTVGGGTRTLVARNAYNEVGQLGAKNLHSTNGGASFGQSVSYSYNERGWLRRSSSGLFSLELRYNTGTNKYYNGNIAYQLFSRKYTATAMLTDTFTYRYDNLNRLREGMLGGNRAREGMLYDRMGNIEVLNRRDNTGAEIDNLSYTYGTDGRLASVRDANTKVGQAPYMLYGTTQYTYDANGNIKTRSNGTNTADNISAITYNYLDLPQSITASGAAISYTYDGSGRKLRSAGGINGQTRDYIDGIEYADGTLELIHTEEGRILRGSSGSYTYDYVLKDHLGNARAGFSSSSPSTPNFGMDYHPFGLQYPSNILPGSPKNNYLYNGKELQDKLKWYDYGARFYDPVIGRWGSVDPLAEKYYALTPYQYAGNTPVNAVDIGGKLFIFVNGFKPGEWFSTKLPTTVPNQYGTISPNAMNFANTIDRSFHKGNNTDYWGDVSGAYMSAYSDNNAYSVNGSFTPKSSASLRYNEGMTAGENLIEQLESGAITLKEGETIKIVGHSQGAAYAAGIASALAKNDKYGGLLEFVDYISPHQPGNFSHPKGIKGRQFSTKSDKVSSKGQLAKWFGNSSYQKIDGAEWGTQRESVDSQLGGHEIGSWLNNLIDYWRSQGIQVNVIE